MIYFQISDVHDFCNLWAEHFCYAPITWSSMNDLWVGRPSGQTNYLHKWHVFHKDKSHTFNQPLLMIGNNLTDCTKFSVVVMSCEDFDYSKKVVTTSLHTLSVQYEWHLQISRYENSISKPSPCLCSWFCLNFFSFIWAFLWDLWSATY